MVVLISRDDLRRSLEIGWKCSEMILKGVVILNLASEWWFLWSEYHRVNPRSPPTQTEGEAIVVEE